MVQSKSMSRWVFDSQPVIDDAKLAHEAHAMVRFVAMAWVSLRSRSWPDSCETGRTMTLTAPYLCAGYGTIAV